jgi:Transcriptional activator of acetoin/glycerol metabolism
LTDSSKPEVQFHTGNSNDFIKRISKIKEDILSNNIKPDESDYPRKDVIESWLRSYHYGLNYKAFQPTSVINQSELNELLLKNKLFIDIANQYIDKIDLLLEDVSFKIFLSDENGIVLYLSEKGNTNVDFSTRDHHLSVGSVWKEATVGTCAHGLCILKHAPVQLIGPEHYNDVFKLIVAFSAPVFDINYTLIGTINMAYYVPDGQVINSRNVYSLWLVTSLAQAVQNEIWMAARNETMRAALNDTKEAVLIVNNSGAITQSNIKAAAILKMDYNKLNGMNIYDLWKLPPAFLSSVQPDSRNGLVLKGRDSNNHQKLISAQLVYDHDGHMLGYVLKFDKIKNRVRTNPKSEYTKFNFDNIIGQDPRWSRMIAQIKRFAKSDTNILLMGESGCGKEVLTQAIHNYSRPDGPFMAVNCAAIPSNLIESELFGYEGGSFTGAFREGRPGKIEMAANGTLFLDEIGDMPWEIQPTLLRALEDKRVLRVGGSKYIDVDFRLVAATNKNLRQLVKENKFREDLYFRLAVFKIDIPPLRERSADIIRLARYFIDKIAEKQQIIPPVLDDNTITRLIQYNWPGNVRELENSMLYAMNTFVGGIIRLTDLPTEISGLPEWQDYGMIPANENYDQDNEDEHKLSFIESVEKRTIIQILNETNYKVGLAAESLGMSRSTLYRKLKQYDISAKQD